MKFLAVALSIAAAGMALADPFVFTSQSDPPDVLIGFRQLGTSSELVGDLGSIFNYTKAAPGSSFLVTNVPPGEITKIFPSLDGLQIDIFAGVSKSAVTPGNPIFRTLWLVSPRTDVNVQTSPWTRKLATTQGTTANKVGSIGNGAASYSAGQPVGPDNTTTYVVLPSDLAFGYSAYMGQKGNFGGTFGGDTELTLPANFATDGVVARLDFYQLAPLVAGQTNTGTYLGYFEFGTDATLSFHAVGGLPSSPPPQITEISRNNSVNSISFSTLPGGYTYKLLRAPSAGLNASIADWTVIGSSITGTGNPATLTDSTDDAAAFYRVQVSP